MNADAHITAKAGGTNAEVAILYKGRHVGGAVGALNKVVDTATPSLQAFNFGMKMHYT